MVEQPAVARFHDDLAAVRYRPDIDGLRAIAVVAVVLFHAGLWPLRSGYAGVDIFFVISGYLIGGIIYRDAVAGRFTFARFYARRARRILPALFVVVTGSLALGLLLLDPSELHRLGVSAGSALAALSNVRFWLGTGYFSPDARNDPMLMTWSLGVEEQFYIFFPFVLLGLRRLGTRSVLPALLALSLFSLTASAICTAHMPTMAFYLLPTRAWELGAGAMLAIFQAQGGRVLRGRPAQVASVAGLGAVAASLVVFNARTPFPGLAALLPVLGTVVLIASGDSPINRRVLGHRVPVAIGRISYSWYLLHWPLMTFVRICSIQQPPVTVLLTVAVLSLALAALSWRLVEQPFRRPRGSDGATVVRYGAVLASMLVLPMLATLSRGMPGRFQPGVAAMDREVVAEQTYPCLASMEATAPNLTASCVTPGVASPSIALIGDSHAAALGPGLQAIARRSGWGSLVLTKSSCRPMRTVTVVQFDRPGYAEACRSFMRASFERVLKTRSVSSVILAGLWSGPLVDRNERYDGPGLGVDDGTRLLTLGLDEAVRALRAAGKQVFIAEDVPRWTLDPMRLALLEAMPLRHDFERLIESGPGPAAIGIVARPPEMERAVGDVASTSGARLLRTTPAFCTPGCRWREGAELFYVDTNHLSKAGGQRALALSQEELFPVGPTPGDMARR
ncbi:acyltransferase family protein [Lichenicoccus roseus]|uniref:Acyltransferase n=1 Tax=Lichenicoccus roseus TaxID=2683649 RepID=A0A5R9JDX7_9PROT|nr:acyltransferase family protein [Lichenicoccus roseus]TLU73831.1 acyltransferase [Lichenicoccus roseus]